MNHGDEMTEPRYRNFQDLSDSQQEEAIDRHLDWLVEAIRLGDYIPEDEEIRFNAKQMQSSPDFHAALLASYQDELTLIAAKVAEQVLYPIQED